MLDSRNTSAIRVLASLLTACVLVLTSVRAARTESEDALVQLLAAGDQAGAEAAVQQQIRSGNQSSETLFWSALLARSRFQVREALPIFMDLLAKDPDSVQGRVSSFVAAIDTTEDPGLQLHYFNALLAEAVQYPNFIPAHWLVGIMTRTLTGEHDRWPISGATRARVLDCGVRGFATVLKLLGSEEGPFCVHQTYANLLDELEAYEQAATHREIALKKDRYPVSLHGAAWTFLRGGKYEKALACVNGALMMGADEEKFDRVKGDILWAMDRVSEAIESWEHAVRDSTQHKSFYWNLCSEACMRLGRFADAKKYSARAVVDRPDVPAYQIRDARLAAILGEPDGPERVKNSDTFDFNGAVISRSSLSSKDDKNTPLMEAAGTGNLEALRREIRLGSLDELSGKYRQSALMVAALNGFTHIVEELLRAGASLDVTDSNGDTALHYASQFNQPSVVRLLVEAGAKTHIADKWKQTPLTMAASHREIGCFRELVHKSPLDAATPYGGTALHYASGFGLITTLRELIAAGADVNSTARANRQTPLMAACEEWPHPFVVTPLIEAGAAVNQQDAAGKTALHYAINPFINRPLVELLLKHGADPMLKDRNGITCLYLARCLGFEDIALQMETGIEKVESFVFPHVEIPNFDSNPEHHRAAVFTLPLLFANGSALGNWDKKGNKKNAAKEELKRMFGIEKEAHLLTQLRALERSVFPAEIQSPSVPAEMLLAGIRSRASVAAESVFRSGFPGVRDDSAWIHVRQIYLARLGLSAGYLHPQRAEEILRTSTQHVANNFSGWSDFLGSFLLGACRVDGWQYSRYDGIAKLLFEGGPAWPRP